ncbi:hypothetical protein RRF57_004540 [Xylaria bambusicola]|uniref:Uncharacterized protein n=1 Tax=Xylaria bambusicola TaxID=326684 RepID=A0AAN7UAT2_9PEZI
MGTHNVGEGGQRVRLSTTNISFTGTDFKQGTETPARPTIGHGYAYNDFDVLDPEKPMSLSAAHGLTPSASLDQVYIALILMEGVDKLATCLHTLTD